MILCDFCGKEIRRCEIDTRNKHHFCDTGCDIAYRRAHSFYKRISVQGREARATAVARSNHLMPRRRKKGIK